ncbi:hypothetical protein MK851_05490 [Tenacibaculum sp. 1B UA]|uniref:hypothetical protein n=1 Tax=Tenacibaculum sp. 1B UA TaxID=2922252 RepID=UPI002A23FFED|nr:hypothetical protein [Tenacibaculum sp. 1B UA]MDX8553079.1 hypothetical protein [Tenacibaculum sp. 1B UA]
MTNKIFALLSIIILSTVNGFAQENLKDYYYPIGTKKTVKIYKYVHTNNPEYIEYKKVTINPKENTVLTESYSYNLWRYNSIKEKLNSQGSIITHYTDFYKYKSGDTLRVETTITDNDVYKWKNDDTAYKYTLEYEDPRNGKTKFEKERIKIRLSKVNIAETVYKTVEFLDQYSIYYRDQGRHIGYHNDTYYAKGVGIVKYVESRMVKDNGEYTSIKNEFELTEIISEKEFKSLIENAKRE